MRKFIFNGMNIGYTAPDRAQDVSYDNTSSGLSSGTTQAAIDELSNDKVDKEEGKGLFSGSYNDLTDKPSIPTAVAVKGNAETDYRTGNVNLTPSNIGTIYANSGVTINSLNEFVALLNNSGGQRSFCVTAKINSDIGVGVTGWQRVFAVSQNGPNNQTYSLGMFCLFFPADTSTNIKWALIDGHTDGAYTISGTGTLPYTDHTYSAGTGIGLSGTSFYLPIPRVAESCNSLPGSASLRFREYTGGSNYNLPSNAWYQILEIRSEDTKYGTQLALGMTTDAAYYRKYSGGSWGSWKSLIDTNTTYSAGSNITLTGTTFSLTKANVTGALGYTPPTTNTTYSAGSNITLSGTTFSLTKANVTGALGYTPPTSDTNNAVTITNTAASNANYRILYGATANDNTLTEGARKGRLFYNPNNHVLFNDSSYWALGPNYFNQNNITVLSNDAIQSLYIAASTEANYRVFLGVRESTWTFCPHKDKELRLGNPSYRWGQIYSGSGTINTSDRKEKKDIESLDEKAKDLIMKLNPVSYKFINGESGRTHYGMVAQDVEEELTELGISPMDFAGFCKDQKYETQEEEYYIEDEKRIRYNAVPVEGEYTYGLRYEEFIAPLIKTVQIQQKQIDKLEKEIELLKKS